MTTINNIPKKILNDVQETSSVKSSNSNKETSSVKSSNINKETSSVRSSNSNKETSSVKSSNSNKETSSVKSSNNKETSSEKPSNKEDQYGYYKGGLNFYKLLYILPVIYFIFYTKLDITLLFFVFSLFTYKFFNKLFIKSLTKNCLFWCTYLIALIILSSKYGFEKNISQKIISGLLTAIISMYGAWYVHYLSHTYDFRKKFNSFKNKIDYSSKYKFVNAIISAINNIIYFICDAFDFHSKIHHNPHLNKRWYNRVVEFLENFIIMSVPYAFIANTYNIGLNISSTTLYLNKTISILWGLIYTTIHNINYSIINPQTHKEHHLKDLRYAYNDSDEQVTNYGPDTIDIICDTKYKSNIIEDFNHASINVITITIIIIIIKSSNIEILRKLSNYI